MAQRYNKRAFSHNYYAPFIYHIILSKKDSFPVFGKVIGDANIPYGSAGCADIQENKFGQIISKSILGLPKKYPIILIYQFKVMPDHVHMLLRVQDWSDYHLDFYIKELTEFIAKNFSKIIGKHIEDIEIFEEGYCDKPLLLQITLDGWYKYLQLNPHRLAMRIQYPNFFKRIENLRIGERDYAAYGNLFLFSNPDKSAIKISRSFSDLEIEQLKKKWCLEAKKGTIMVSPFISPREKEIRKMIEKEDGKIILITHEIYSDRYKPSSHNFELCSTGRLLIISLGYPLKTNLSREICNEMNKLAVEIEKM